ncbi:unnamed protein product [Mytilus edulis]|uniref:Uncharacterized protein n=1 Tax=Mytilus edulis TaxID=6550 RepID=A0A8S3TSF7_MYTED|nr:unnamed protein product [Mytilus edulis]
MCCGSVPRFYNTFGKDGERYEGQMVTSCPADVYPDSTTHSVKTETGDEGQIISSCAAEVYPDSTTHSVKTAKGSEAPKSPDFYKPPVRGTATIPDGNNSIGTNRKLATTVKTLKPACFKITSFQLKLGLQTFLLNFFICLYLLSDVHPSTAN